MNLPSAAWNCRQRFGLDFRPRAMENLLNEPKHETKRETRERLAKVIPKPRSSAD